MSPTRTRASTTSTASSIRSYHSCIRKIGVSDKCNVYNRASYVNNDLFIYLFTCLFICRSSGPANTGNPSRRQTGPRLCEEAETTIRHVKRITREEREEQTRGANSLHTSQRLALILRANGGRRLKKGNKRRGGGGGVEKGKIHPCGISSITLSFSLPPHSTFLPIFLTSLQSRDPSQIYFSVNRVENIIGVRLK